MFTLMVMIIFLNMDKAVDIDMDINMDMNVPNYVKSVS
jgi:hypothetical protein